MDGGVDELVFFDKLDEFVDLARLKALEVDLVSIFQLYCSGVNVASLTGYRLLRQNAELVLVKSNRVALGDVERRLCQGASNVHSQDFLRREARWQVERTQHIL